MTRLVGTQEKLFFRETLGESVPAGPIIGVFLGVRQHLVARDWGYAQGLPHRCCRRAMWVP